MWGEKFRWTSPLYRSERPKSCLKQGTAEGGQHSKKLPVWKKKHYENHYQKQSKTTKNHRNHQFTTQKNTKKTLRFWPHFCFICFQTNESVPHRADFAEELQELWGLQRHIGEYVTGPGRGWCVFVGFAFWDLGILGILGFWGMFLGCFLGCFVLRVKGVENERIFLWFSCGFEVFSRALLECENLVVP